MHSCNKVLLLVCETWFPSIDKITWMLLQIFMSSDKVKVAAGKNNNDTLYPPPKHQPSPTPTEGKNEVHTSKLNCRQYIYV